MSGLAFQKLNGTGTTAYDQLEQLGKLILEMQRANYPDLYKMARLFAPTLELIALTKTWEIPLNSHGDAGVSFDGHYFGLFKMHLTSTRTGDSNTNYRRSVGKLHDGADTVAQTSIIIHGNDTLAWTSDHADHTGFATGMSLSTHGSNATDHGLAVQFIGFRLGEGQPFPTYSANFTGGLFDQIASLFIASVDGGEFAPLASPVNYKFSVVLKATEPVFDVLPQLIFTQGSNAVSATLSRTIVVDSASPFYANPSVISAALDTRETVVIVDSIPELSGLVFSGGEFSGVSRPECPFNGTKAIRVYNGIDVIVHFTMPHATYAGGTFSLNGVSYTLELLPSQDVLKATVPYATRMEFSNIFFISAG